MKKTILDAGKQVGRLVQAGRNRYLKIIRRSAPAISPAGDKVQVEQEKESKRSTNIRSQRASESKTTSIEQRKYRKPTAKKKPPWTIDNFKVTPEAGKSRFHDYEIPLKIMRPISELNYKYCTPIQEKSLKIVLEGGDLVGKANTGTGKTAVFLIAILSRLLAQSRGKTTKGSKKWVRALVLAPTRELAVQITKDGKNLGRYCHLAVTAVYGGTDYQKQQTILQTKGCDVLVATPGRLLDFVGKNIVDLSRCEILVLDEADRMLDMGFIPDVRRIVGRLPRRDNRQTMLFSATVPDDVKRLASQWCVKPVVVEAEPEQVAVETVEQTVYLATTEEKYAVLYNLIKAHPEERIIVFANMKNETKRLADRLQRNDIDCVLLSGDVAQNKRMKRLEDFRAGKVKILVATDVAGRGIHIDGITFVVNYTLPYEPEDYVHRIGRTGRAGADGKAVSFACEEGSFYLPEIEDFIGRKIECIVPGEDLLIEPPKRAPYSSGAGKNTGKNSQRTRKYRRKRSSPARKKQSK